MRIDAKIDYKISNEEILEAKGIMKYTAKIDPAILKARTCMGWLSQKADGLVGELSFGLAF